MSKKLNKRIKVTHLCLKTSTQYNSLYTKATVKFGNNNIMI